MYIAICVRCDVDELSYYGLYDETIRDANYERVKANVMTSYHFGCGDYIIVNATTGTIVLDTRNFTRK